MALDNDLDKATAANDEWKTWARFVLNELKEAKDDIKNIYEQLKVLSETLVVNTNHLDIHMMRTENAEKSIHALIVKMTELEKKELENKAVTKYKKDLLIMLGKIFGGIGFIVGLVYTILQIISSV